MIEFLKNYKTSLVGIMECLDTGPIAKAVESLIEARLRGNAIYVCGNGGSAAAASHFATDLSKGCNIGKPLRFRAASLVDNLPSLTAYANDFSYEDAFLEQLRNVAQPGDLVVAISGSGNSPNVVRAIEFANAAGLKTIALTGNRGGILGPLAQIEINVPERHMGRIEDCHLAILHMIAYFFMEADKAE